MVFYDYYSNAILTKPLKNNTTPELERSQTRLIQYLLYQGLNLSALRINNKCLEALGNILRVNSFNLQMCPPNYHHTNQAEKAIDTWKFHFLAGLSGVDPNFPLHLWCLLLPQAIINFKPPT